MHSEKPGPPGLVAHFAKALFLFLLLSALPLSPLLAFPPQWDVPSQRAIIVSLEKPDPNAGGRILVTVQCVDKHDKPTTDHKSSNGTYTLIFPGDVKIIGITRAHGPKEITFDDLHVGMFVRFSGGCTAGSLQPATYKIYLP